MPAGLREQMKAFLMHDLQYLPFPLFLRKAPLLKFPHLFLLLAMPFLLLVLPPPELLFLKEPALLH